MRPSPLRLSLRDLWAGYLHPPKISPWEHMAVREDPDGKSHQKGLGAAMAGKDP